MFATTPPPDEPMLILEAAVLRMLLIEHPRGLKPAELADRLAEPGAKPDPDALEVALQALQEAGLVEVRQGLALPSRAARHFDGLPID